MLSFFHSSGLISSQGCSAGTSRQHRQVTVCCCSHCPNPWKPSLPWENLVIFVAIALFCQDVDFFPIDFSLVRAKSQSGGGCGVTGGVLPFLHYQPHPTSPSLAGPDFLTRDGTSLAISLPEESLPMPLETPRPLVIPVDKPQIQLRTKKSIISFIRSRINNTNNM